MELKLLVPVTLAILGLLFGLYRWIVHRTDKRHEAHEKRFTAHGHRFDRHESRIEGNERQLTKTREQLHREYVRVDQLEKMTAGMTHQIELVHQRIGGMAKELNQAIGTIKANGDAEMKAIVNEIKDALKHHD